ncbi:S-layer homology domain-containing protein [Anaerotalea alkaliphila]|uniref:S-layer homology domain-containing protein n=1 Tax=Anaerotalea alkaliphila TaxID=2662126 RepID=A0A7X5HT89_9FIRM|nr:S-layer homology domain-containing protein [Anaerotalea alkaliphila]NDL66247.1 S-layer homology domain-containing protein [Anaerotalea alkaliphila]
MRITSREKLMLSILVVAVLGWLSFTYVIDPQMARLSEMRAEMDVLEEKELQLEEAPAREKELDGKLEEKFNQVAVFAREHFNTTPQEEQIILFNDLFALTPVEVQSMRFSEPEEVLIDEVNFLKTNLDIAYTGNYPVMMNVLNNIWTFPKTLKMASLDMRLGEEGVIGGNVSFELLHLVADSGMVDNLYAWYVDPAYDKQNPFIPFTRTNATVRYIYTGEGGGIFNTGRFMEFTDIGGHWMEEEIKEFLKNGYVYMNPYNTFLPDGQITRGDFVVLLDNVYQWKDTNVDVDLTEFTDYESLGNLETSYAMAIHKGFLGGFVEGYTDKTLRPMDPITYEEVENIMRRIKDDEGFSWTTVAGDIRSKKNVTSERWSDPYAFMSKAEAVYLLTYFK